MDETVWDGSVIRTDVQTVAELARTALNHSLELLRLLPAPIPTGSRVYASLEAIRSIPLQAKANASVGDQVDSISQLPTQPEDSNISLEYEIINIKPEKQYNENPVGIELTEPKLDDVAKPSKSVEAHEEKGNNYAIKEYEINEENEDGSKLRQTKEKLQDKHIYSVESDKVTDADNDTETSSLKSSYSTLRLEDSTELHNDATLKDLNVTQDVNDINNETVTYTKIEMKSSNMLIKENKREILNLKQSPGIVNQENISTNSTSPVTKNVDKDDSITNFKKSTDNKPKPREVITFFNDQEDVTKCLEIAKQAMAEDKYEKAKRMAEKAERIYPTMAGKALLKEIADKAIDAEKSSEIVSKKEVAKISAETLTKEAVKCYFKAVDIFNPDQNSCNGSGAESMKGNADSQPVTNSPETTKKLRAVGCLDLAQEAFSKGDISKAEKLAKKAQKVKASEETDKFLLKIQKELSRTNEKKENADPNVTKDPTINNLMNKVKDCLSSGRLYDAEQALRDIKGSDPTVDVQSLESQIRAAKASRSSTDNIHLSYPEIRPNDPKSRAQKNSVSFLGIAENALAAGDYIKAEEFLKKAYNQCPSDATEKLLQQVQIKLFSKNQNDFRENILAENKVEAESLYERAQEALLNKKFSEALELAVQSQKSHRLTKTEVLKKDIIKAKNTHSEDFCKKFSRSSTDNIHVFYPEIKPNDPKYRAKKNSESFQGIAENAIAAGDYIKAEEFLKKAYSQCPSDATEKLLQQVQIKLFSKKQNNARDNTLAENKAEAESLYERARKALLNKKFDEALELAVQSEKSHRLTKTEVLKKDIIKAKNTHSEDLSCKKMVGLNEKIKCCKGPDNVDKAISFIIQAKTELKENNVEKAKQLLVQSLQIFETQTATDILNKNLCNPEPIHNSKPSISYGRNHDEAQKCMKIAETAMKDNDFERAEHYLNKSLRIAPSNAAKEMLEQVKTAFKKSNDKNLITAVKNEITTDHEHLTADVEQCFQIATNAISADNLEKAEKFLKKAERIQPTEKARELLDSIQQAIEHERKEEQARLSNEAKAEPLIACAVTAISEELYDVAEIILMNAWIKYKSSTAKQMLEQVEEIITQAEAQSAKSGKKKNKDKSIDIVHVKIAKKIFELADNMVTDSDYNSENVECMLIIAQNIHPTKRARELLIDIRENILGITGNRLHTKNDFKYSKKTIMTRESFKYNSYVQMAQSAFESGDYNITKEFLLEAEKAVPASKDIKKLIKQVDDATCFRNRASERSKFIQK